MTRTYVLDIIRDEDINGREWVLPKDAIGLHFTFWNPYEGKKVRVTIEQLE